MTSRAPLFVLAALAAFLSVQGALPAHATTGCNAIGWDEPHGVTGCQLYYPAVSWLYKAGIASGNAKTGKFEPERTINRAEFTKLVLLASGTANPPPCASAPFPDVSKIAWYAPYICAAKAKGIISGFPDGTFKPEINVNYANASKILIKAFGVETHPQDANVQLIDEASIWFRPYTMALLRKKAVPETVGSFTKELTRGEMAEALYRLKTGKTSIVTPLASESPEGHEYDDIGMGFETNAFEQAMGIALDAEPDAPFVFAPDTFTFRRGDAVLPLKGYAFSHSLQQEGCDGETGMWSFCHPILTDWSIALYMTTTASTKAVLKNFTEDFPIPQRYFGGKPGKCVAEGFEGDDWEYCFVDLGNGKTLVSVVHDLSSQAYGTEGITPSEKVQAYYARIRKGLRF
jgi:hypothetical protein